MAALIDTVLEIDTPEHLAFRTRIAGPGRRFAAWIIDLLVWLIVFLTCIFFIIMILGSTSGLGGGVALIATFLLYWFYFVAWEILTGGRSAGKMAMGLRVVRNSGLPITFRESILRNLLRAADILPMTVPPHFLLIAPVIMVLDAKFRRAGDLVAGTIVVIEEATKLKNPTQLEEDPTIAAELPAHLPLDRRDLEAIELLVSRGAGERVC
ncbi:MAG: RDD family protein [Myxococcota bacterium]